MTFTPPAETAAPRLSVVIVTYRSAAAAARMLPALARELGPGDELIVVDNASGDGTLDAVAAAAPGATVVASASNDGFAAGCNRGAARASGELLLFLNPDAMPAPGFGEAIRRPLRDGRGWAAWMGLVTAQEGRVVNTSGGVIHFTGIAWAGEAGLPVERAATEPHEVAFVSGACLAVPRAVWEASGGFAEDFFMYHEDVELSLRLRLAGGRLGIEPAARVDHDYEFHKGQLKWRLLERNRWATIVRTYPAALLVLLAPALAATELALVVAAARGGWLAQKARGTGEALRALPQLLRERRALQRRRALGAREFAAWLEPALGSAYLPAFVRGGLPTALLRGYWAVVLLLLRLRTR